MIKIRDHLRKTQIKATNNLLVLCTSYMLPVNFYRIIDNIRNNNSNFEEVLQDPGYIIKMIEYILINNKTRLYTMTEEEMKNHSSVKNQDDRISKTAFSYALYDALAPRKCILSYKLGKNQIDEICKQLIKSFNKAIVEPGEMVGIVGAQSIGEPVTQLMLDSFHYSGVGGVGGVN